jgi:Arc/MetJ family transcription regulator
VYYGGKYTSENMMDNNCIRTNIVLDKQLLDTALQSTGIKTRRELIEYALREVVRHKQQRRLLTLKGAIEWEGDLETMRTAE